jgi:hypothetical protein
VTRSSSDGNGDGNRNGFNNDGNNVNDDNDDDATNKRVSSVHPCGYYSVSHLKVRNSYLQGRGRGELRLMLSKSGPNRKNHVQNIVRLA